MAVVSQCWRCFPSYCVMRFLREKAAHQAQTIRVAASAMICPGLHGRVPRETLDTDRLFDYSGSTGERSDGERDVPTSSAIFPTTRPSSARRAAHARTNLDELAWRGAT